ncbi:MAG: hypothetical protein PHI98_15420, partial [Eubacteriales bacterium]|nr:hypothetical protein [Eubacteriales bacterium]
EAIRAYTPQRCIIADIHSGNLTGESMARLGVALSYHLYEPRSFCAPSVLSQQDMESIQWPYIAKDGRVIDAEQAMNELGFMSVSANDLIAAAKQYNVGVTIGEFGAFAEQLDQPYWYSLETQKAFLRDMTDTFQAKGVSWCYGVWNGVSGLTGDYPILNDTPYEKLAGTTQYMNTELLQLFREINQWDSETRNICR